MQIECKVYSDIQNAEWDKFIETNKRNATFLHSRKFFLHNPQNKSDDASLMFYKKNKLKAVLPACLYKKNNELIFHSHPRSTYGGYVTDVTVGVEEAIEIVQATKEYAQNNAVNEIIIRNPFRIFYRMPSDETDYAMWYHGFTLKSRELECTVKLDELSPARYENGAKYNIKKAWKYVEVKESDSYNIFWTLLTSNLLQKHNSKPVHTLEDFLYLRGLVGGEKIKMFSGYINEKFVCGVVVFLFHPQAIHAQYIASDDNYQDIRPLNAVIDFIITWGNKMGYTYFNLGTANEDSGKIINYGLFHFKEGFGGRGVLRETMHLVLN